MDNDKIALKTVQGLSEAAAYIEDFSRSLRAGKILIEQGMESMTLCPPEMVEVEVEVRSKKDKQKFTLAVSWRVASEQDAIVISPVEEPASAKVEPKLSVSKDSTQAVTGQPKAQPLVAPVQVAQGKDGATAKKTGDKAARKAAKKAEKKVAEKSSAAAGGKGPKKS